MNFTELTAQFAAAQTAESDHQHQHAITLYEQILQATVSQTDDPEIHNLRLKVRQRHGVILGRIGQPEAGLTSLCLLLNEAQTPLEAIDAHLRIGNQLILMGRYTEAYDHIRQALDDSEKNNYTLGRIRATIRLARLRQEQGRLEEAIPHFQVAFALAQQLNDPQQIWFAANQGAIAYLYMGQLDKAIQLFNTALEHAAAIGLDEQVTVLNNLGEVYQMFDLAKAYGYHQQALQMLEGKGMPFPEADLRRNMGVDLVQSGQVEAGIAFMVEALRLSRETQQPIVEVQVLYSLVLAELKRGDLTAAATYADALKKVSEAARLRSYQAYALYAAGLIARARGDNAAAEQAWQQALFQAHQNHQQTLLWQIHAQLAQISINPALAQVHNQIAAEVIHQMVDPIQDKALQQCFLNQPEIQAVITALTSP